MCVTNLSPHKFLVGIMPDGEMKWYVSPHDPPPDGENDANWP